MVSYETVPFLIAPNRPKLVSVDFSLSRNKFLGNISVEFSLKVYLVEKQCFRIFVIYQWNICFTVIFSWDF
jgi:hypothetical protein